MEERPLIGIITAKVANPEQKQLLSGVLEQAHKMGNGYRHFFQYLLF